MDALRSGTHNRHAAPTPGGQGTEQRRRTGASAASHSDNLPVDSARCPRPVTRGPVPQQKARSRMTSVLTGRVRRGARGLMAGSLALGLAATALAVGATSANAVVDPAPAWVNNPDLPASCGLDVMLVLDASKSIATSNSTADVKAAAPRLAAAAE